jgi:hypothetical protein
MTKFWEAALAKFADRWAAASAQALVFWASVALVLQTRRGSGGLPTLINPLSRHPVVVQVAVLVGAFLVIMGSALIVRRFAPIVLLLMQGPWRGPGLGRLSWWLSRRIAARAHARDADWQKLAKAIDKSSTVQERERFVCLDTKLRRVPPDAERFLPTPVGNLVRAADCRIEDKYGLVVNVTWPRLWLLLPQHVRDELVAARLAVDSAVSAAMWGLGFASLVGWAWWAAPAGVVVVTAALVLWLPQRVEAFTDLVESAFDLHRFSLYEQLRVPVPECPQEEPARGAEVTQLLYRGVAPEDMKFARPTREVKQ